MQRVLVEAMLTFNLRDFSGICGAKGVYIL